MQRITGEVEACRRSGTPIPRCQTGSLHYAARRRPKWIRGPDPSSKTGPRLAALGQVSCPQPAGRGRPLNSSRAWSSPADRGPCRSLETRTSHKMACHEHLFNKLLGCLYHCLQNGTVYDAERAFTPPVTLTA